MAERDDHAARREHPDARAVGIGLGGERDEAHEPRVPIEEPRQPGDVHRPDHRRRMRAEGAAQERSLEVDAEDLGPVRAAPTARAAATRASASS